MPENEDNGLEKEIPTPEDAESDDTVDNAETTESADGTEDTSGTDDTENIDKDNQSENIDAVDDSDDEDGEDGEDSDDSELGGAMTFLEHLTELRTRMIRALISLAVATVICFIFADHLIEILLRPIPDNYMESSLLSRVDGRAQVDGEEPIQPVSPKSATATIGLGTGTIDSQGMTDEEKERITWKRARKKVIATHPIEPLIAQLKVSLIAGIFLAFPFLFYEAWMFIAPGLYKRERRFVIPLVLSTWFCFVSGGLFSYFIVYEFALSFFISITPESVDPLFRLNEYLSLTTRFLLAFGIIFEEPVVITLLAKIGLVTHAGLSKFRPYAIVLMFALSALITPPDPFSQMMCAIPLYLLYELSLLLVILIERKREAVE